MSHYEINYKDMSDKDMRNKAIEDTANWLDVDVCIFKTIMAIGAILQQADHPDKARIPLAFAGIQGYPVEALWKHVHQIPCAEPRPNEPQNKEEPELAAPGEDQNGY